MPKFVTDASVWLELRGAAVEGAVLKGRVILTPQTVRVLLIVAAALQGLWVLRGLIYLQEVSGSAFILLHLADFAIQTSFLVLLILACRMRPGWARTLTYAMWGYIAAACSTLVGSALIWVSGRTGISLGGLVGSLIVYVLMMLISGSPALLVWFTVVVRGASETPFKPTGHVVAEQRASGWYPDPKDPARNRYWNGSAWLE